MSSATPGFDLDTALEWISGSAKTVPAAMAAGMSVAFTPVPPVSCLPGRRFEISRHANATQQAPDFRDALRRSDFLTVYKALDVLQGIDPSEDYFIETRVADDARLALSLIYMESVPSPKILPHDAETLAFSWPVDDKKLYLTVAEGTASLLEAGDSGSSVLGCSGLKDGSSIVSLLQTLGAYVRRAEANK